MSDGPNPAGSSNQFDPFTPESHNGYNPRTFMTNRGEEGNEPVVASVKINKNLHEILYSRIIGPDSAFPEYSSLHDFANDAFYHRIHFLLSEGYLVNMTETERQYLNSIVHHAATQASSARRRAMDSQYANIIRDLTIVATGDCEYSWAVETVTHAQKYQKSVSNSVGKEFNSILRAAQHRVENFLGKEVGEGTDEMTDEEIMEVMTTRRPGNV